MAGLSGPNMFESISFDLSSSIVSGQTYMISFYAANSNPVGSESLSVGVSTGAASFGTQAVLVPLGSNAAYTQYSATFTAPISGSYLTIEPAVLGEFWFGLDDFSLEVNCTSSTSSATVSSCESYTVPSGDETYTTTGIYNDTIPNSMGCDSVMTITVNINNSTTGTDIQSACDTYTWIDGNTYTASNSTATHILSNAFGCDSLVSLNLTINTVSSSITQAGALLTADELGATYQWLDCPAMTSISGANAQSYTAPTNGDYAVIVTNNGCSDTSTCYTVTGVGITENDFGNELLLYPNPTNGNFSIDLGDNYQTVNLTITDLSGKLIMSNVYNGSQLLNLKLEEAAGVYLLTIESGDLSLGQASKKAVIRLIKE